MKMINFQIQCVGYMIAADWYEGSSDNVWLDLIGFTSDKARYAEMLTERVEETGDSVLVIDYSGHGESPFNILDLTPAQNFLEVITAYEWIKKNHSGKKISISGNSYGCFMAAQLVKYREVNNMILRAPALYEPDNFYTTWRDSDMNKRHNYRKNEKDLDRHPLFRSTDNVKGRVLVVTHELDDICPPNSTDPYIKAFNAEHIVAKGFDHSFKDSNVTEKQISDYNRAINDWINR